MNWHGHPSASRILSEHWRDAELVDEDWDATRFHFYLHPDTSRATLKPWAEAGLPLHRVDTEGKNGAPLTSWGALNAVMGLHSNQQILRDVLENA